MKTVEVSENMSEAWRQFLNSNQDATIFHTLEWRDIIQKVFHMKPLHLMAETEDGRVAGILPLFLCDTLWSGKKLTSMPFNFYGGCCTDSQECMISMLEHAIQVGKEYGVRYIELKMTRPLPAEVLSELRLQERRYFILSVLDLSRHWDQVEKNYQKRLRQEINTLRRRVMEMGLEILWADSREQEEMFYETMIDDYRMRHLTIPLPAALFHEVFDQLCRNGMAKTLLATHRNKVVGGLVLFFYKMDVIYAWGVIDPGYAHLSPLKLLLDEAIRYSHQEGYRSFNFGITSPYHVNLLSFKSKWGADSFVPPYYYHLFGNNTIPTQDYFTSFRTVRKFVRYMPKRVIKLLSSRFISRLA